MIDLYGVHKMLMGISITPMYYLFDMERSIL